ncbi:MAG: pitrilysin family protein, partial [Pseudomonadota bacterium]
MSLTSLSIVALAAIAFMFAGLARPAQAFVEEIETYVLDNGLEVIVIPDRRAPVVTHMIWYRVGSADEPEGYSGIAHFLEHLMFKGTEDHPDGEFSDVIISLGGRENAFTSSDYTAYFQRVAREHLGLMMQFEADRMENLVLSEEVVAPERDVVIEERKSRVDNNPSSRLGELIDAMLYVNHPYGRPVIGWMHEIEALDRDAAIDFYDRFYTPNNAILVVAGDVEPEDVLQLAEETYGQVERRAEPGDRERPRDPAPIAPREVTLTDPRVTQESLRRAYVVPSYTTDTPGEAEALDVMANILGGGSTSFLYQRLVVEERIASSAGAFYSGSALDDGRLTIFAVPAPGVDLDALEAAIDQALADFANLEITEERLARAQYSLVASAIFAQDDQSTMARVFGIARTTGQTVED